MKFSDYLNTDIKPIDEAYTLIRHDSDTLIGYDSNVINYWKARGHELVAIAGPAQSAGGRFVEYELMSLTPADKIYAKDTKLKPNEYLFRVTGPTTHQLPLVKVNVKRGLIYFLSDKANSGEIDHPDFEPRGVKLKFLRHVKKAMIREDVDVTDDLEQIDELSHDSVKRYFKAAAHEKGVHAFNKTVANDPESKSYHERKEAARQEGIKRAISKLSKRK